MVIASSCSSYALHNIGYKSSGDPSFSDSSIFSASLFLCPSSLASPRPLIAQYHVQSVNSKTISSKPSSNIQNPRAITVPLRRKDRTGARITVKSDRVSKHALLGLGVELLARTFRARMAP